VPEISRFSGVVIAMYYRDHDPPHFHAYHGGQDAAIGIVGGKVLWGRLPGRILKLVQEWRDSHVAELMENWDRARAGQPLFPVQPLE
jgi:Domain of unknown function (DUF4160)